jgi:hypothetical protein
MRKIRAQPADVIRVNPRIETSAPDPVANAPGSVLFAKATCSGYDTLYYCRAFTRPR